MGDSAVRSIRRKLGLLVALPLLTSLAQLSGLDRPAIAQLAPSSMPGGWATSAEPAPARLRQVPPEPIQSSLPPASARDAIAVEPDELATAAMQAAEAVGSAASRADRARPVIVIDPGHGGVDPGAIGPRVAGQTPVLEKNVVLTVGKLLAAALLSTGRYDVVLTRSGDTFVPLDQRAGQSRRLGADLFVSLHADSVAVHTNAQAVRGASVYSLSDEASDEQARLLAEKENAADQAGGMPAAAKFDQDQVRNILVDLMRRETAEFSTTFRATVVAELARHIAMAREPQRAAAFRVLKQTEVPSVLIELGYMSNVQDQKLLQSAAWQSQVAGSIATAIDRFFVKRHTVTADGAR